MSHSREVVVPGLLSKTRTPSIESVALVEVSGSFLRSVPLVVPLTCYPARNTIYLYLI